MKKGRQVEEFLEKIHKKTVISFIDKVSFPQILLVWILTTVLFGFYYFLFSNEKSYLIEIATAHRVNEIFTSIYYSFIAATTTGFGDIIPRGSFQAIAVLQVIIGLLLLAVVTSKLVSIKQDVILGELYDLSINGHVSKIRSSLLLFRQNIDRIIVKLEEHALSKRELHSLYNHFAALQDAINEILPIVATKNNEMLSKMDPVNIELTTHSMISSINKIEELLEELEEQKLHWKTDLNKNLVSKILDLGKQVVDHLESADLPKLVAKDLRIRFETIATTISERLEEK
ncbi:MAG: two pore domain potassium channel family protein [Candidatus Woesearchaeota archaeon]|nr:MAG: two pore domain potassium channel family protein [Candidatus Woesearchaeota archaeon]